MEKEINSSPIKEAISKLKLIEAKNGSLIMSTPRGEPKTGETVSDILFPLPDPIAQEVWSRINGEKIKIEGIDNPTQEGVFTHREEINAIIKAKNEAAKGNFEARDEFLSKNDRLIFKNVSVNIGKGLDLEDLEQEGRIGLLKAFNKFDWKMGYKFSTYAEPWVKHTIRRALGNHGETVRHPIRFLQDRAKLRRTEDALTQELKRPPSDTELAEKLKFHPQKVRHLKESLRIVESLDAPLSEDGERIRIETIPDEAPSPDELSELSSERRYVLSILDKAHLSPREKEVWSLLHLLEGGRSPSFKEVGEIFGFNKKWAKQLESRANRKLRYYFFKENPQEGSRFMKIVLSNRKN